MRTVQMTLDEDLIRAVDKVVKELKTTRSAFARTALQNALRKLSIQRMEKKHRRGYELYPVSNDEVTMWEAEQDWGRE